MNSKGTREILQAKEINGILLISAPGRIETQNAQEVKKDFRALKKQSGTKLTVQDISPEVYEIFETTGFLQILDVTETDIVMLRGKFLTPSSQLELA